jgi:hypothetical protein
MRSVLKAAVIVLSLGMIVPSLGMAAPLYRASGGGVQIVLTDEPCAMSAVSNLAKRSTWTENGKTLEGCWGVSEAVGLVMAYWSDRTVTAIPAQIFVKVQEV